LIEGLLAGETRLRHSVVSLMPCSRTSGLEILPDLDDDKPLKGTEFVTAGRGSRLNLLPVGTIIKVLMDQRGDVTGAVIV
jgi:hypothetical protein